MPHFPQRPASHTTGDKATKTFLDACPDEWIVSPIHEDYGIDFRVELPTGQDVTGMEFYVQVKGRAGVSEQSPRVGVKPPTLNYWLGKLNPTLIVLVDTARNLLWFEWLETAYDNYPNHTTRDKKVFIRAGNSARSVDFENYVSSYVDKYFFEINEARNSRKETDAVMHLMLHFVAINRYAIETMGALSQFSAEEMASLTNMDYPYYQFFLAFGSHDALLLSVWREDGAFHGPVPRRIRDILGSLINSYLEQSEKFWMRNHERPAGDLLYVPVRWHDLHETLPPVISTIFDIQQLLSEFMVLGTSPTLQKRTKTGAVVT